MKSDLPTSSHNGATQALSASALHVDRAITELRRGRFVEILNNDQRVVMAAVDTLDQTQLQDLLNSGQAARFLLSGQRASVFGKNAQTDAWQIPIGPGIDLETLHSMAGLTADLTEHKVLTPNTPNTPGARAVARLAEGISPCEDASMAAGLKLARIASLAPALVSCARTDYFDQAALLSVQVADIWRWGSSADLSLLRVSDARVPLQPHKNCRFVLYRERYGGDEHIAIVVGEPAGEEPVLVRLHSACFTGDLFASLRCDCGEQLRSSVERMAREGGGIILYLAQEGRGIGLANKLRAYELQEQGLDTLDADRYLGFCVDERTYGAACSMLQELGIRRVRLMTNNPAKIAALRVGGIEVVDRLPLNATSNPHNARYMQTKRDRAGHLGANKAAD